MVETPRAPSRRARSRRDTASAATRADAFTLVTLAIFVAVLNVMVAAALPLWTQQIQREKEEELIFRGLQYAEAIRLFQKRAGRYPVRLEELLEVPPRSLRQLWKDPMTDDGKWDLILAQGQGQQAAEGRNLVPGTSADEQSSGLRRRGRRGRRGGEGERVTVGPITGVRSRSKEKAIKRFLDGQTHDSWLFTVDILPIAPTAPGELIPSLNSKWVGRPFPEGVELTDGTGIQDAEEPAAEEERRNRRGRRRRGRGDG